MAPVLYQRLSETTASIYDIHKIVDNPVFKAEHDIQVSKTDVGIYHHNFLSKLCQPDSDICCGCRLSDAAFS